ncbi:MAG: 50S ribosomal protein L3 [bacterium]|nr:50S ribosomal protein L3 [bacterium]
MKCLLAQKLGMTQVYDTAGELIPVTVVSVAPNVVTYVRTKDKDGYEGVQVGTGTRRKLSKAVASHVGDLGSFRWLREFRMPAAETKRGDKTDVGLFSEGDTVQVTSTSKGKGFAGVVKRHGFKGGPASHGHPHNLRAPGSIGCRFPQHTHKGKRMAGRMGGGSITVKNLKIVKIDGENQLIAIGGAVPGSRGTLVQIVGR